jgi:hypothetical protein
LKIKKIVINDQLHDIRDDIITLEEELKKQSTVVENPYVQAKSEPVGTLLGRTKSAGYKDTVSMESNKMQPCLISHLVLKLVMADVW